MKKENYKKMLATIMAGTMALTLMPMTALATENTGSLNVDIDVVDTVVRVQVPTYMAVSIDEFEQKGAGSQIYSTDFEIKNLGSTAVKVNVASTFATSNDVNYVDTIDAISDDTDAWIGAVAAVSDNGRYVYSTTTGGIADLTDASDNVASVVSDGGNYVAKQSFYLDAASGDTTYKIISGTDLDRANMRELNYSQFYEITTANTTTFITTGSPNKFNEAGLLEIVEATSGDNVLYAVVSDGGITRIDKDAVYEKLDNLDSQFADELDDSTTWYISDEEIVATPASGSTYIYAEYATASTNGVASFRYIGRLAAKETENWDDNAITTVNISYTIKCLSKTDYDGIKDDLTLGYTASAAKAVAPTFTTGDGVGEIKYTTGSGSLALGEITKIELTIDGQQFDGYKSNGVWADATDSNGIITFDSVFINCWSTSVEEATVYYNTPDGTPATPIKVNVKIK